MSKITLAKINLKISHLFWLIAILFLKLSKPAKFGFDTLLNTGDRFLDEAKFYRRLAEKQIEEFANEI